ncbi:hypothetical protein PPYR_09344 [Photinus pyralis]|uniref:Uncharacterized protein n=1 Tax=Photinus pyralis TaxID=7054 RepID=A0A5N4AM17_PHOPY|nr:hypothetical protein PPYR_09344 [Photinus pyralis]
MQELQPADASNHDTQRRIFKSQRQETATHVYIRIDATQKPLSPLYEGPYPVSHRTDKLTRVTKNGKTITVSNDRIKPAYIETSAPQERKTSEPEKTAGKAELADATPKTSSDIDSIGFCWILFTPFTAKRL